MQSWASTCQVRRLDQHGCWNNGEESDTAGPQGGKEGQVTAREMRTLYGAEIFF